MPSTAASPPSSIPLPHEGGARTRTPSPAPSPTGSSFPPSQLLARAGLDLLRVPTPAGTEQRGRDNAEASSSTRQSSQGRAEAEQPPRNRARSFWGTTTSSARPSTSTASPASLKPQRGFIRRAKSFGTSPILGSASTFGGASSSSQRLPSNARLPPTPPLPSPPFASARPTLAGLAISSSPEDILDPPVLTISPVPSPTLSSVSFKEDMVLPEPPPVAAHWLFQPGPLPPTSTRSAEKGKAKESLEVQPEEGRKRKTSVLSRKSGGFSFFKRNEASTASIPTMPLPPLTIPSTSSLASNRSPATDSPPDTEPSPSPSPLPSPAGEHPNTSEAPVLPSLQLSPYRMSWAFGSAPSPPASATTSPVKARDRSNSGLGTHEEDPNRPQSRPRSHSNSTTVSASAPRAPSPLKNASDLSDDARPSSSYNSKRRSTTGEATNRGVFGTVAGLFGSSNSNMLRSSSSSSLAAAALPVPHETSEFGALFDKSARKRGLSVGNSIFGGDSRKRAGSSSSLVNTWTPPSGSLLAVPSSDGSLPTTTSSGRTRASTDPRRFSLSSNASSASYPLQPPKLPHQHHLPSPPASPTLGRQSSFTSALDVRPSASRKSSFTADPRVQRPRTISLTSVAIAEDETPESFVQRLTETVTKSEVSRILASTATPFHATALTHYMTYFDFSEDPLDIALRKFLMGASLPTETQQIDRVMEAFAKRYIASNPGLWTSSDTPYVLAFSLVMLSTDQFNPSNKSKMTKADYVKNARIEDVSVELLEYFFDQITLTPFVFVEDDEVRPDGLQASVSSSSFFSKNNSGSKLDPYHMIATGMTRDLRISIESRIPAKSPFSFTGTTAFFNATTLHRAFAAAPILQINNGRPRAKSSAPPAFPFDGAPLEPVASNTTYVAPPTKEKNAMATLKITKIGLLSRKEDLAEGGKKAASRKWKGWSTVLTSSQLLFFKDTNVATSLQETVDNALASQPPPDDNHVLVFSITTPFKPDAVLSLSQTAAIYDSTYSKHANVFRLVAPAGRQYLFQAKDADDLNSWLAHINYAASFKTANLRIRGLPSARNAAAVNPIGLGLGLGLPPSPSTPQWTVGPGGLASPVSTSYGTAPPSPSTTSANSSTGKRSEEGGGLPQSLLAALASDPAEEEATPMPNGSNGKFAANDYGFPIVSSSPPLVPTTPGSEHQTFDREPITRAEILRAKIASLETQIAAAKAALQTDLRTARNFSVLTPFRNSTRDRLVNSLRPIEERVRKARIGLCKLVCHREVLARDLLVEDREHQILRKISQHSRHGSISRRPSTNARPGSPLRAQKNGRNLSGPPGMGRRGGDPTMTFHGERGSLESDREDDDDEEEEENYAAPPQSLTDDELDRLRSPPLMQRSQTETTGARLRAASTATSMTDDELPFGSRMGLSPEQGTSGLPLVSPSSLSISRRQSEDDTSAMETTREVVEEEEAEDWQRTRAGKRVSLINYPKLDGEGVNSLMRIREERRSEIGVV